MYDLAMNSLYSVEMLWATRLYFRHRGHDCIIQPKGKKVKKSQFSIKKNNNRGFMEPFEAKVCNYGTQYICPGT